MHCRYILPLLVLAQPAWAVPYAKVVGIQASFLAMPPAQRDKLVMQVRLVHVNGADRSGIHAWVLDGDKKYTVPLAADGSLPDTPNQDWIARDLQLQTDQPKGSVRTQVAVLMRPPGGQRIGAAYLRSGVAQAQAALTAGARQVGGYMATFAVPALRVVKIRLAGCCNGTATGLGAAVLRQGADGNVAVPVKLLDANADALLTVSAPVTEIDPDSE